MRPIHRLGAILLLAGVLLPSLGCRAIENPEELETLAAETPQELPVAVSDPPSASAPTAADSTLDGFPLVGSAFPGLGGRLHSSLCDPASDPYGNCF